MGSFRQNKNKLNIVKTRNSITNTNNKNNVKSKTINHKQIIQKKLKSNINLSNEYTNYCGSFLYPDYEYVPGKTILNELKSNGAERTINKYFSKNKSKVNYIKNTNTYAIIKNRNISTIKSKYINYSSNNISIANRNIKNKKIIKNKFNYTTCVDNNKKVTVLYEYSRQKPYKIRNDKIIKKNKFGFFGKKNSFNSRNSKSSSTSCNSIKMKNVKKF